MLEEQGTQPDRWVAIGLEDRIQPASSNPVQLGGYGLAVWRGENGPVNVWEDRCPHRGMRLSYGFVRGNLLRCIYHGWGYEEGSGQCVSIPAHPDLTPPKTICARTFPAESRYGIVWTNLSPEGEAKIPDAGEDAGWKPVRSLYLHAEEEPVREHAEKLLGEGAELEAGDGILVVRRPQMNLLLAFQKADAAKTAIHVVASGPQVEDVAACSALAAEMEQLRDAIETAAGTAGGR